MSKDKRGTREKQGKSTQLERQLVELLWPILSKLNEQMDRRLVSTFLGLVMAIVIHRHRNQGLLLSELGGYLLGAEQCCAGTKRLSNLIHSEKWETSVIEQFLWKSGTQRVEALWEQGVRPLVIWDESVFEKPESLQRNGCALCALAKLCVSSASNPVTSIRPVEGRSLYPGFIGCKSWLLVEKGLPHWHTCAGGPPEEKRKARNAMKKRMF